MASQDALLNEVRNLTGNGSDALTALFHSDPALPMTSPIRVPFVERVPSSPPSSPLSPVPKQLDALIDQQFALENGDRDEILLLPKAKRMELAMDAVRSGRSRSAYSAAFKYSVNRWTLSRRLKGKKTHLEAGRLQNKLFPAEQACLVKYINSLASVNTPTTYEQVC